jgi:ketosteroid isomerase-like protein
VSEANVEVVRRVYEAVAARDAEAVLALYDPDVEWDFTDSPVGNALEDRIYRGHEGLRRWWREWQEAWEGYEDTYRELIDAGEEAVVSVTTSRGRGRASGAETEWTQHGVWTIAGGRVTRVVWFRTRDEALAAAGAPD